MNVLMASRHPVGGIRTFIRYVYSQSSFADCSITFLGAADDVGRYLAVFVPAERLKVIEVQPDLRSMVRAIRSQLRGKEFDLLHSHGLTTGVSAELARFGSGVPHLLTVHDVFLPSTFHGARGRMQRWGLNLALRRCDAIHAVSDDCANNLLEFMPLVKRGRVHSICNGIDARRFREAEPVDARADLKLPEGAFLIGFFGRFMAQKGFRTLVDAVEILVRQDMSRQVRVLTFGWGGFIREDYAYLEGKNLGAYFVQCPETHEPERWMKAMDVVAMPSRWEACPLQPMEALVAGVPFIGTNCIGLREVIAGTPALVADIGDPESLSASIRNSMEAGVRSTFESYAPKAAARFDVAETANRLRQLYGETALRVPATSRA